MGRGECQRRVREGGRGSTFYVHFADKEDLLLSGFDDLPAELASLSGSAEQPFAFAEPLVEHASENERLFRALVGSKSGPQIETRDGGHVHGEQLTGEAVEPDELFGG